MTLLVTLFGIFGSLFLAVGTAIAYLISTKNCVKEDIKKLIAIAISLAGLVFFVVTYNSISNNEIIKSQEIEERAIITTATVIGYEPVISVASGRTIGFRLVAEQEIDGIRYVFRSGRFILGNPIHDFPAGSTVPVFFDPLDSNNNRIDKDTT